MEATVIAAGGFAGGEVAEDVVLLEAAHRVTDRLAATGADAHVDVADEGRGKGQGLDGPLVAPERAPFLPRGQFHELAGAVRPEAGQGPAVGREGHGREHRARVREKGGGRVILAGGLADGLRRLRAAAEGKTG